MEEDVLARWERERTFEATLEDHNSKPKYVFYDGPPFATGLPHYGHILTSYIKDSIPRYFTMRGFHVARRWGWDCHGLPVEYEVEKDKGFRSKREILEFGIGPFNEACKNLVLRYAQDWRQVVVRMGRWVDFDGAYKTMDLPYMESVLWAFKSLHEKGLVYSGSKIVPYCVRCQTVLSNFEARLDDAFRPRKDVSVFVKFRRVAAEKEFFVAWTTTPWTLPANVALAVGSEIEYSLVSYADESLWVATNAIPALTKALQISPEIIRTALGSEFVGEHYSPVLPYFADLKGAFLVLPADFIDATDGTGIVHIAPSYGEEDYALAASNGLPSVAPVNDDGTFDLTTPDLAGLHLVDAGTRIRDRLREANLVLFEQVIEHSYPHCWRCDSPLIYRAVDSWFVKASAMRDALVTNNQSVAWIPEHIKHGRFGDWIANARDWAVSRSRFWGTPIPAWECSECKSVEILGSVREIENRSQKPVLDLHRPHIDEHVFPCKKCSGEMKRVPDVFDCWFESGAMPFASQHYPFAGGSAPRAFPADFIVEYLAQTRGWFYTLFVLATGCFDTAPFRSAMCHGVILAGDGRKMSKRLKNYPDPMELMHEHGSDALRVALLASPVSKGENTRFSGNAVRDAVRRYHLLFWNCLHFYTSFASIDGFDPASADDCVPMGATELDKYLLHEVEFLREELERCVERYDFAKGYAAIERFINVLSTWYIRLNKQRIWREGLDQDKILCYRVLFAVMRRYALVTAPFFPFLSEHIFMALGIHRSVHLHEWPTAQPAWRADELAGQMEMLRSIVSTVRNLREVNGISQRVPLPSVAIYGVSHETLHKHQDFLREELNVKSVDACSGDIGHLTETQVQLKFERIGKQLSHALKPITSAVKRGDYAIAEDGTLHAAGYALSPEDYESKLVVREAARREVGLFENVAVVLNLQLTDALRLEGAARELNRRLQDLRKKARLKYSDRVRLLVRGGDLTAAILAGHGAWLFEQVLAVGPLLDEESQHWSEDFALDGEMIRIGLAVVP